MFAFGITTLAMRSLLPEPDGVDQSADRDRKRCRLALCLLTIAGIIFRAELALFLATNTLFLFLTGRVSIKRDIVPAGLLGLLVGLTTTVLVDSFFWQSFPLWPELSAFTFNIVSGQSAEWGTSPWHFYFTSAIPRLLLNPFTYLIALPVSLLTPSTRRAASSLLIPSLAFVAIYSFQPHKEWRFIIYTIPPLTGACALGAAYIWTHRAKSLIYRLLSLVSIFSVLLSLAISTCILLISSTNYPGALALHSLHDISTSTAPEISVYLGNLACQTGVTRFLETPAEPRTLYPPDSPQPMVQTWHYDKTEDEAVKSAPAFWDRFEYILVEGGEEERVRDVSGLRWEGVKTVGGFGGVKVLRPGQEPRESEGVFMSRFVGVYGYRVYEGIRGLGRSVTRGWWVEVRMEPKIKILRRIDR